MPQRTRYIRPEFFTSPDTAKASLRARLLYAAMWGWTDEYGVGETKLNGLLGHAFPESDGLTVDDLVVLLREIGECYGTVFYQLRGRAYFHIPTWTKHQTSDKRTAKRHPLPDHPEVKADMRFHREDPFATGGQRNSSDSTESQIEGGRGKREWVMGNGRGGTGSASPAPLSFSHDRPPDRCPDHLGVRYPGPCPGCADARKACERYDREHPQTADDKALGWAAM